MKINKTVTMIGTAIAVMAAGGNDTAIAGIDAGGSPKSAKGPVSQFGSVYVNGVRYRTDDALFVINGMIGSESDLSIGQVVTVQGKVDADGTTGVADVVIYDDIVTGPVSFVDTATGRIEVLGQTVHASAGTSLSLDDGAESLAGLQVNDIIEVSGHVDSGGDIIATHIRASASSEYELTGTVGFVDDGEFRLVINDTVVDYGSANLYGLAGGMPQPGMRVEVIGANAGSGGEFIATRVYAAQTALPTVAGTSVEIEGIVTRFNAPWHFEIDGVQVIGAWSTRLHDGWWFDVGLDRKVEVEGRFDADGRLVAEAITFEQDGDRRMFGQVQHVGDGFVVVNGAAIRLRADTEFEDDSELHERHFGTDDLHAGDYVSLLGYDDGSGFVATRLERDGADDADEEDEDD